MVKNVADAIDAPKEKKSTHQVLTVTQIKHLSALLFLAGVHLEVVQERLGHSRIDMTLDTYSHIIPGMQKESADKMDDLLGVEKV